MFSAFCPREQWGSKRLLRRQFKPRGGVPSGPGLANGLGLLAANCQKQEGGESVLY